MKKSIRTAVAGLATVGLLFVGAAPGSAETLDRNGASKVVINPVGAPEGAQIVKAKVTVKKGKKTVARNKNFYRAKKGKYKVTSTITYRMPQVVAIPAGDVWAECRVTSKVITSDRTAWRDWGDGTGYYADQATVQYVGTCVDDIWVGDTYNRYTWDASWSEDEFLMTENAPVASDWAALKMAATDYKVGDVDYQPGADLSALPTATALGAAQVTKNTRTVIVL